MPYIGKKPADIIATVIDTTTGTFSGEVDAGSLDVSGNADIDGITNLDNTDIDGTLNVQGETTLQTHLNMGDNDIIKLGDSADLQIYHAGTSSRIQDVGTGNLIIDTDGTEIQITSGSVAKYMLRAVKDGDVKIYYDGSPKLVTTNTGIDVTGTATMDGLTVENTASNTVERTTTATNFAVNNTNFKATTSGDMVDGFGGALVFGLEDNASVDNPVAYLNWARDGADNSGELTFRTVSSGTSRDRLNLASNGNINFYEDTGTTPTLSWNASTERLGIGNANPLDQLHITSGIPTIRLEDNNSTSNYGTIRYIDGRLLLESDRGNTASSSRIEFYVDASEAMRIDANGNVGIGTSSPTNSANYTTVNISGDLTGGGQLLFQENATIDGFAYSTPSAFVIGAGVGNYLAFHSNSSGTINERMRIDSSGNVGIGTTSPDLKLDVSHGTSSEYVATFQNTADNLELKIGTITGGLLNIQGANASNNAAYQIALNAEGGNVGIGTSSPDAPITIQPTAQGIGTNVVQNWMYSLTSGSEYDLKLNHIVTSGLVKYSFNLRNNGTSYDNNLVLDRGSVGIGTGSPTQKLDVVGNSANIRVAESGGADLRLSVTGSNTYVNSILAKPLNFNTDNILRQTIGSNGDISFYEDTGTTPKFFWDASEERLGIGTTGPSHKIDIVGSTENLLELTSSGSFGTALQITQNTPSTSILVDSTSTGDIIDLRDSGTTVFTVIDGGNVGIGTDSPAYELHVKGSGSGYVRVDNTVAGNSGDVRVSLAKNGTTFGDIGQFSSSDFVIRSQTSLGFMTNGQNFSNGTRAVTIDTSGNLLVGKTTTALATAGITLGSTGFGSFTRSGFEPLNLNRLSSDGNIAVFYKDGTTVGSIASDGGSMLLGSGDVGVYFDAGSDRIIPMNMSTLSVRNDAIDIGGNPHRFKDLYLSGGVYLGGTASANKLDDYEEGTWTPVAISGWTSATVATAKYTKIGRTVLINLYMTSLQGKNASIVTIGGLPFTVSPNVYCTAPLETADGHLGIIRTNGNSTQAACYYANTSDAERENLTGNDVGLHLLFSVVYETSA